MIAVGFLYKEIKEEGDEILAYAYPRSDRILDAMKGVLHTSDSFATALADSKAASVDFTTVAGDPQTEGINYSAHFQWFDHFLLVLLLPVLAPQLSHRLLQSILQDVVALVRFMWQDVGHMVERTECHPQLDAFFQQLLQSIPIHNKVDMRQAVVDSFVQGSLTAHLPVSVSEQVGQLLTQLEATQATFSQLPTSKEPAFFTVDQPCGSKDFVILGALLLHRGLLLQSTMDQQHTKDAVRYLRFAGFLPCCQGDGQKIVVEPVQAVDYSMVLEFVLETAVLDGARRSAPKNMSRQRSAMLLAVVSQDDVIIASLLKTCDGILLGRPHTDWVSAMQTCLADFLEGPVDAVQACAAHASPLLLPDELTLRLQAPAHKPSKQSTERKASGLVAPDPLLQFLLYSPNSCHVIFPMISSDGAVPHKPPPMMLRHLERNFAALVAEIQEGLRALEGNGVQLVIGDDGEGAEVAQEYGVHVVERRADGAVQFGYWVVGLLLPEGGECFLCYEDTVSLNVTDMAVRLLMDLQ